MITTLKHKLQHVWFKLTTHSQCGWCQTYQRKALLPINGTTYGICRPCSEEIKAKPARASPNQPNQPVARPR